MLFCRHTWFQTLSAGLVVLALTVPGRAVEPDALTPSDAEAVIKINLKQILDSGLFKKHAMTVFQAALKQPDAQKFIEATGLDPLKDLDSVTVASSGTHNPKVLIVIRGRFDQAKIAAAMEAEAKKDEKLKITKEGAYTIYETTKAPNPFFTAVPDKGFLVMATDKNNLLKALKSDGPGKLQGELKAALGKINGKESLWLAAIVTDEMRKGMAQNPQTQQFADKLKAVTAGLTLTDSLHLNVQILTTDAKAAMMLEPIIDGLKAFLNILGAGNEQAAPIVKEFVENIKVGTANTAVTIDLTVSEELLKKSADLFKAQSAPKPPPSRKD